MKKVIFVCTGNTCRSPMAEYLLRSELKGRGVSGVTVESAGTFAGEGHPASRNAILAASKYGLDLTRHASRPLSTVDADGALVLCMSRGHMESAARLFPSCSPELISEYAGETGAVPDPYGGSQADYDLVAGMLARYIKKIAEKIQNQSIM